VRSYVSKIRSLLVVGLALVIALTVSGGASGLVHTYFGPDGYAQWAYSYSSGFNYPQYNRVYRPVGNEFWLWYSDGAGHVYQFESNTINNPFVHNQPGGYRQSVCTNRTAWSQPPPGPVVYPTTCQYGT
jgi:hypothetical protein